MSPCPSMSPGKNLPLPKCPTNHESFDRIRRRVRKACDRCRLKKTKCDGSSPCLRCRTDNVICCSVDGQKMRRRNFPKGYAEMLEKQHNQLVCGLQELYRRLQNASLWEGEPLDESTGRPLAHDILAALNILQPKRDGADETEVFGDFVEQPESSLMRDETSDAGGITPKGHRREMRRDSKRQKSLDPSAFIDSDPSTQNVTSGTPSQAFPNNVTGTEHSPEQLTLRQQIFPRPSLESAMSLQGQLHTPSSSLIPSYDTHAASSQGSSLKPTDWNSQVPAVLQPLMTQMPGLYGYNSSSSHRMDLSASRPPFSQGWFENGIGFDSSDFMTDFHQLSPQGPTGIDLLEPEKAKGWT